MKLVSNRETRCVDCGGRIGEGEEIDYLPAAGQFKPEARHLGQCPKKKKTTSTATASLRVVTDPEDWLDLVACSQCQRSYTLPKGSGVGAGWVGACCSKEAA